MSRRTVVAPARLAAGRIGAKGPVRVVIANANAFGVTGTLAGRRLVLRPSIVVQDPAGNRRTIRKQVTPRLAAPRHSAKRRAR